MLKNKNGLNFSVKAIIENIYRRREDGSAVNYLIREKFPKTK